jgi:hypothetical protein
VPAAQAAAAETSAAAKPVQAKPVREVEPIDLLAVTGTSAAVRRTVPMVVSFLVGAGVGALIVWLFR